MFIRVHLWPLILSPPGVVHQGRKSRDYLPESGGVSSPAAIDTDVYFLTGRGRAAAPQEPDIHVGTPKRGKTHFMRTR